MRGSALAVAFLSTRWQACKGQPWVGTLLVPGSRRKKASLGNKYWVAEVGEILSRYPRDIYSSFGFPGKVKNIDAAIHEEETAKTYFFVPSEYWRYDENMQSTDAGYPKEIIHDFPGIGKNVDAVFEDRGFFYFFHGKGQYKSDPKTKQILAS
ncbi:interstitial collagenase-like [Eubalaena glacialis]|uniref:interstitial collagenase-like n=1 Tax=Eubalaena glacialis TaxID=27606 RepID=UPI002A598D97|nr:interstitial collagenase-like [Eubalaena glacialis]